MRQDGAPTDGIGLDDLNVDILGPGQQSIRSPADHMVPNHETVLYQRVTAVKSMVMILTFHEELSTTEDHANFHPKVPVWLWLGFN